MIPVRFQEYERYDISKDADVVLLMATTPKGCYSAEVVKDSFRSVRESKAKFKEKAIELIVSGKDPCKVEL